jgi:hypothetical protein
MKYVYTVFLLINFLNVNAQNISYDIGLVLVPIVDSIKGVPYTESKARQFRSVYKSIWGENLRIKIVSKPLNKNYKVKFKGRDSMYKYSGKYFIIDGILSSYKLSAKSVSPFTDVKIFGVLADELKIRLQYFQSGYIGTIYWNRVKANSYKSYKLSLLLPAISDLQEFSGDGLLLILPDLKKVR